MTQEKVEQRLLRISDAATYLGITTDMLYDLMQKGHIPFVKVHPSRQGSRRIDIKDIDAWIARKKVNNDEKALPR